MLKEKVLSEALVGAMIEVHRTLGPGLLESAYLRCLCHELTLRGIRFRGQVDLPVVYKGIRLDCGYRIDLIVEDKIIVEVKSVAALNAVFEAQLLTYMKLTGIEIGYLANFNSATLIEGLKRMVL